MYTIRHTERPRQGAYRGFVAAKRVGTRLRGYARLVQADGGGGKPPAFDLPPEAEATPDKPWEMELAVAQILIRDCRHYNQFPLDLYVEYTQTEEELKELIRGSDIDVRVLKIQPGQNPARQMNPSKAERITWC